MTALLSARLAGRYGVGLDVRIVTVEASTAAMAAPLKAPAAFLPSASRWRLATPAPPPSAAPLWKDRKSTRLPTNRAVRAKERRGPEDDRLAVDQDGREVGRRVGRRERDGEGADGREGGSPEGGRRVPRLREPLEAGHHRSRTERGAVVE